MDMEDYPIFSHLSQDHRLGTQQPHVRTIYLGLGLGFSQNDCQISFLLFALLQKPMGGCFGESDIFWQMVIDVLRARPFHKTRFINRDIRSQ